MAGTVLTEEAGDGVRVVTLNRPQRLNAITPELLEDLIAALQAADRDAAIRAVVLDGRRPRLLRRRRPEGSSARSRRTRRSTRGYIERIQDVTRAMLFGDKPVIGAIRGWAVGGGLGMDRSTATSRSPRKGTRFFFPETALGVFVDGRASPRCCRAWSGCSGRAR